MRKILIGILCIFSLYLSSCGPYETNKLRDGFKNAHTLILPFELETSQMAGTLYFKPKETMSLDEMKIKFENENYYIEESEKYPKEHFLIGIKTETSYKLCFIIEKYKTFANEFTMHTLLQGDSNNISPFPTYLADNLKSPFHGVLDELFNQFSYYAETNGSFADYMDFYNHSLTEIIESSPEKSSITVKSISRNNQDIETLTTIISIFTYDGKTYVGTKSLGN